MELEYSELGFCPRCDAPGAEYRYVLTGPRGDATVVVEARIQCPVCGYRSVKRIAFPLEALYAIRYMLVPSLRVGVEKMYVAARIAKG